MKPEQFCYWLQGAFEVAGTEELNKDQVKVIKDHLGMVFAHDLDPKQEKELADSLGITPEKAKEILDAIHQNPNGPQLIRC